MPKPATTVLLLAFCCSTLGADGRAGSLAFRLSPGGDIVVPVTIGGQGPFSFLLDTGSSRTAISTEAARRLGLRPVAHTLMLTPSGQATQALVRLDQVAIGPASPVTVMAMTLAGDDLDRGLAIDGLIGQDVLHALTYTIDYERRELTWDGVRPDDAAGVRLRLTFSAGRFLVNLPQQSGTGRPLQLVPDTGADCLVLFDVPGGTLPGLTPLDIASMSTLSGRRLVRRALVDVLDVGDVGLVNQIAVLARRPEGDALFGDGLLPLHLFSRVTFNGPERYLIVEGQRYGW